MRKIISIILTVIVTVFSCSCISYAVGKGQIAAESKKCRPGETIEIAINVTNNPGIIAVKFSVDYDKNVLKLLSAENGNVFNASAATFSKSVSNVPYTMLWEEALSKNNINTNGTLAVLRFEVVAKDNCSTSVKIKLDKNSTFDVKLDNVNFDVSDGKIEINSENTPKSFWEKVKDFFIMIINFVKNLFK